MTRNKQSPVSAPPTSGIFESISSKETLKTPNMTSRSSSTRSSGSAASTSASPEATSSNASSNTPCDCLRCSPDAGFCKFSKPRKSHENFDASHFPLPHHLQFEIDTRRLSRNDDPMMHLNNLADQEDRAFDSFMRAACQYNKSTTMAAAACKKLIHWSLDKSSSNITDDAAIVKMARVGALFSSITVGKMANAVSEVRSTVHSPEAKKMFNDPSSEFSEFVSQSMPTHLDDILPKALPCEYFTPDFGNESLREYLKDIKRNAAMVQESLASKVASKYAADGKNAALSTFYKIQENLKEDPESDPSTAACESALRTTSANMRLLTFLNKQLTTATENTSMLIDLAIEHASRTRRRSRWSTLKHLPSKFVRFHEKETAKTSDKHDVGNAIRDQLERTLFANIRTSDAVRQAKRDIQDATLMALEPVEHMTGGRTPKERVCLNVKVESVY